jgi:hypothetical protein
MFRLSGIGVESQTDYLGEVKPPGLLPAAISRMNSLQTSSQ